MSIKLRNLCKCASVRNLSCVELGGGDVTNFCKPSRGGFVGWARVLQAFSADHQPGYIARLHNFTLQLSRAKCMKSLREEWRSKIFVHLFVRGLHTLQHIGRATEQSSRYTYNVFLSSLTLLSCKLCTFFWSSVDANQWFAIFALLLLRFARSLLGSSPST